MKTGTIALIAAAGLGAYYFIQTGVGANTARFVFDGVTFQGIDRLTVRMLVQNVSNARINLNAMAADITMNDTYIGNANFFPPQPMQIEPTSQQVINFNVALSLYTLPAAIQTLIQNPSTPINFKVDGNANINTLLVPFTLTKTISF